MGQPIRGMTRPLPVKAGIIPVVIPPEVIKLDAGYKASIHNRFDVEVIDALTGKIKQRAHGENVICSQLWARLFAPNTYFNYIHYGTGSGTPASTDTSLFTFLGYGSPSTSDDVSSLDYANCVYSFRRKIRLSETTAVGAALTEVGIGYGTSASTLCTHAMLKDANGNQISIAKTNTDIVNIYATVYAHWSNTLYSGSILFAPSESFLKYLCGLYRTGSNPCRAPVYAQLSKNRSLVATNTNGNVTATTDLSSSYDLANKKISQTMTRLGVDYGNRAGGSFYLLLANYLSGSTVALPVFAFKAGSGWFTGTDILGESIGTGDGVIADFATSFDCPSNAIVYVDGVQSTGVAIDNAPLSYSNMEYYLEEIIVDNGIDYPAISSGNVSNYGLRGSRTIATPPYYYSIFYNPYYSAGIKSYIASSSGTTVEVSDDLVTWTAISASSSGTKTVPEAYRNYKYWRITSSSTGDYVHTMTANTLTGKNIHFTTPPAFGAVITADYHTPVIAKDANHVFDLSVTIQLGEYTP